jgi:alkylated DNA repair dioxygenase AlkB
MVEYSMLENHPGAHQVVPESFVHVPGWIPDDEATALCVGIVTNHYTQSQTQKRFGNHKPFFDKTKRMSRHGVEGVTYSYKGKAKPVYPLSEPLIEILARVNGLLGSELNCVVINYYLSGGANLYPHTDITYIPQLGERPIIAAVSFGATRDFDLIKMDKSEKITMPLNNGDLFVMHGESQLQWKHGIPGIDEADYPGPRISLTLRHHPI